MRNDRLQTADGGRRRGRRTAANELPSTVCRPSRRLLSAVHRPVVLAFFSVLAAACGPEKPNTDIRAWTDDFEFRVTPDVIPPRAIEPIHYSITVRDKKTHEPIANGQGRIFATNKDGHSIYDGFTYGPEVGVYHATLFFVTSGNWAMNLQFRRDSTKALQKPDGDWLQTVDPASEPGSTKP